MEKEKKDEKDEKQKGPAGRGGFLNVRASNGTRDLRVSNVYARGLEGGGKRESRDERAGRLVRSDDDQLIRGHSRRTLETKINAARSKG